MSERYCNKCGYFGPDEIHNKPGHLYQCGYLSSPIQQPDTIQVSRAEYEALQKAAGQYYRVMDLLRDSMHMKHGLCEPRERRACTRCNATDDLATMVSEYRGAPFKAHGMENQGEK